MKPIRQIRAHYEDRISRRRENFDVLDWGSAASQLARFDVFISNVDLPGKTLLDIGCGLGDLWARIKERNIPVSYTGVDILEKMVRAASSRHDDAEFICVDLFADQGDQSQAERFGENSFDVVFCSGAFNLDLGNNRRFLPIAVARMFQLAGQCVAFNLLHERAKTPEEGYFYSKPADVLKIVRPYGWTVRILDDYLPNDFTVICSKPDSSNPTCLPVGRNPKL